MDHLHATRAFDPAPLQPSLTLPAPAPQRPREAMPLSLAGKGRRCVPSTSTPPSHAPRAHAALATVLE
eukprot:6261358-Prymnesium_polylepis.1